MKPRTRSPRIQGYGPHNNWCFAIQDVHMPQNKSPFDIFPPLTDVLEQAEEILRQTQSNRRLGKEDLVQIYRPIRPPGTCRKFCHFWSKHPRRVVKVLLPTNYSVRNAQLQHHNKMRPNKGAPMVRFELKSTYQWENENQLTAWLQITRKSGA